MSTICPSLRPQPAGSPPTPFVLTLPAPAQQPVQVPSQGVAVGAVGTCQSAYDDPLRHEGSDPALDAIAAGRQRYLLLGHDDADESRGVIPSPAGVVVHDQPAIPATRTPTNRGSEVLTPR